MNIIGWKIIERRLFIKQALTGFVGGWIPGNFLQKTINLPKRKREEESIHISIHPLAVRRTTKDEETHGA